MCFGGAANMPQHQTGKLFGATYLHEPSQVHRLMGQMFSLPPMHKEASRYEPTQHPQRRSTATVRRDF
jgi:hypothetical protein